jgi:ribosome-binding protein aMBF1 (putative translation factor)
MKANNKYIGSTVEDELKKKMKDPQFAELFKLEQIKYEISELVKTTRKKAGLTQKQLAEVTGIHQAAIERIESRTSKLIPSIEVLRKLFVPMGFNVNFSLHKLKKAA